MGRRQASTSGQDRPEIELTIDAIGARGDGLAEVDGERVFVPLTVPGDRVRVRLGSASGEGRRAEAVALGAGLGFSRAK